MVQSCTCTCRAHVYSWLHSLSLPGSVAYLVGLADRVAACSLEITGFSLKL